MYNNTIDELKSDVKNVNRRKKKNTNKLIASSCYYKDDQYCCIIPKNRDHHNMNEDDYNESQSLMINELCDDEINVDVIENQ